MKQAIPGVTTLFLLSTFAVITSNAQTVSGSIARDVARRGATTTGTVVLDIPKELHVNSSRPKSEYAIPTTVRISGDGVRVGAITYPLGENRKFQFSEELINVYEGTVFFWFNVTVPPNYRGKSVELKAVVRYQACTNEVCYPPRNKEVTINARVL
jgi:acetylornithine deacetylase/succinyl-diaminopimelate desuccinylase-like protein